MTDNERSKSRKPEDREEDKRIEAALRDVEEDIQELGKPRRPTRSGSIVPREGDSGRKVDTDQHENPVLKRQIPPRKKR